MIGIWSQHASTFLQVIAVLTLVAFAIPISLAPMRWARALGWTPDDKGDLALYFGRCLGVVALVLTAGAWYAAGQPAVQAVLFFPVA